MARSRDRNRSRAQTYIRRRECFGRERNWLHAPDPWGCRRIPGLNRPEHLPCGERRQQKVVQQTLERWTRERSWAIEQQVANQWKRECWIATSATGPCRASLSE